MVVFTVLTDMFLLENTCCGVSPPLCRYGEMCTRFCPLLIKQVFLEFLPEKIENLFREVLHEKVYV
jgi:hypothetical protein